MFCSDVLNLLFLCQCQFLLELWHSQILFCFFDNPLSLSVAVADTVFAVVMLLLLMFAVVVLWCCVPLLVSCSALPGCPLYTAEDGAADRHRRAGAAGHTECCCQALFRQLFTVINFYSCRLTSDKLAQTLAINPLTLNYHGSCWSCWKLWRRHCKLSIWYPRNI